MNKLYKDNQGNIYAVSPIQTPKKEWVALTEKETEAHLNPQPTVEQLAATVRAERDSLIKSVRWRIERHSDELVLGKETTLTPEQYIALLKYIQALRDLPAQPGAPWDGGGELTPWPEVPEV